MHLVIAPTPHPPVSFKTLLGLLAAICSLAVLAIPGAADAASASDSPELSLTFPTGEAHLSGSQASVWATCDGPEARVCNGTLTLTRSGSKHQVPFSVIAGTNQSLTVPLGVNSAAKRIVAVIKTEQADGTYLRSRTLLRLS
ncbi:MAG TPA: hypothetical protein VJU14_13195 [Solirubrobacterales bacterium]|nr:hypothetical protein [Solirubrobacterales bacterium]